MNSSEKRRDLCIIGVIYLLAFAIGFMSCWKIDHVIGKFFVFDVIATVVTFLFSVLLHNSSVYDAYWSVAPMVMIVWLFVQKKAFSGWHLLFLAVFLLWAVRLTGNWMEVFTDFSYEDWRYRQFRDKTPRLLWPIVNFFGIHFMPTVVVFAGMLPLFVISVIPLTGWVLPGIAVMLWGILLEYYADRQMHAFLESGKSADVCEIGLWRYSRHPNYLGEISFWTGVYLVMLPVAKENWYYGIGCLSVCILFNVVSIPLMEKRQLLRREKYGEYKKKTSRLLLRPRKS